MLIKAETSSKDVLQNLCAVVTFNPFVHYSAQVCVFLLFYRLSVPSQPTVEFWNKMQQEKSSKGSINNTDGREEKSEPRAGQRVEAPADMFESR